MNKLGIDKYHCVSGDIYALASKDNIASYDVVHCSGVLYHHPHPLQLLSALRKITREYLILTSTITHEVVENKHGRYVLPPSGIIFVPALSAAERAVLSAHWLKVTSLVYGITHDAHYTLDNFGPWWWLPTQTTLKAMCEVVGFQIVESGLMWYDNSMVLKLRAS